MKKSKLTIVLVMVLVIALLFVACGQPKAEPIKEEPAAEEPTAEEVAEEPAEVVEDFSGQTLTVLNWNGYGSDADYSELVFEEMYNCEVNHVYFTTLDEMLNMLRTGGLGTIDVLLPNSS